jgi:TolA-binding protein
MGDNNKEPKESSRRDADAKEKKKKRHALIKELQKQIDEQTKQIESLKLRLQNQLKDSIKLQTTNRQMRRLW